jgi:hypothetical protein
MNYSFIAYIFLSIIGGLTVCMKLMQSGRMWAAILCLILFILIFMFYGIRWFSNGKVIGQYSGSWPPLINTCPDYLVYYKRDNRDTCVDLLGVNRSRGILRSWTQDDSSTNPPADDAKYFPHVYKPNMSSADLRILCDTAQQAGLTWEGITNGDSCTFNPESNVLGPNTPGSSSCPPPVVK